MPHTKVAFRCVNCGHFETSANAGESVTPHACPVCRKGVRFDPDTGVKTANPANWEVLANCTPERLTELELTDDDVEDHVPAPSLVSSPPRSIERTADEGAVVETDVMHKHTK